MPTVYRENEGQRAEPEAGSSPRKLLKSSRLEIKASCTKPVVKGSET